MPMNDMWSILRVEERIPAELNNEVKSCLKIPAVLQFSIILKCLVKMPSEQTALNISLIDIVPENIGGQDCFELWHESAKPYFDTIPVAQPQLFSGYVKAALLDNLVFIKCAFSQQAFHRSHKHLRQDPCDYYVLELYLNGAGGGEIGDRSITMRPDGVYLLDYAKRLKTRSTSPFAEVISVVIPRHLIKTTLRREQAAIYWSTNTAKGQILIKNILSLWNDLPNITQESAPEIASEFIGLLNGLLPYPEEGKHSSQVKNLNLKIIKDFIELNLSNPSLNVEMICQEFYYSRNTVCRLFQQFGGLKKYITEERLIKAYLELLHGSIQNISVAQVAQRYGIYNNSYFSRAFKQRFGVSPSALLKTSWLEKKKSLSKNLESFSLHQIDVFHLWTGYKCGQGANNQMSKQTNTPDLAQRLVPAVKNV